MESQVKSLSKTIPLATNEIADMFAAGARMGVAKDELANFVQEAAKMATAFEMPAGEIAQSMGKIANVVGLPINRINELADTINYLDDNRKTSVLDINCGSGTVNVIAAGNVNVTGDVIADGISLKTHIHSGVEPGGGTSGPPVG